MRRRFRALGAILVCSTLLTGCWPFKKKKSTPGGGTSRAAPGPANLAVTGASKALSRVTSNPVDELWPVLSTDGKTLLLTARGDAEQVIVGVNPNSGSSRTVYTSAKARSGAPDWLPTGKSFVFVSNAMGAFSLVRALSSSPNAAISVVVNGDNAPAIDFPSVSPDGSRVAFQMGPEGSTQIGAADLSGGNFTMLTEGATPAFSPDGKRIAFTRAVGGVSQLFLIDAEDGGNLVQVTSGDADCSMPSWSPDGNLLLFSSNRGYDKFPGASKDSTWNLYLIRPDGEGLTQLTDGARWSYAPHWGSDGWIYFSTNDAGNFDVWRLKYAGE